MAVNQDMLVDKHHQQKIEALTLAARLAKTKAKAEADVAAAQRTLASCVTVVAECELKLDGLHGEWCLCAKEEEFFLLRGDAKRSKEAHLAAFRARKPMRLAEAALKLTRKQMKAAQQELDKAKRTLAECDRRITSNHALQVSLGLMARKAKRVKVSQDEVDEVSTYLLDGSW